MMFQLTLSLLFKYGYFIGSLSRPVEIPVLPNRRVDNDDLMLELSHLRE